MCRYICCIVVLLVSSVWAQSDLTNTVDKFIKELDGLIQEKNMSEYTFKPVNMDFGVASFSLNGGALKNLSSLYLVGDDVQIANITSGKRLEFSLGFKTLRMHFDEIKFDALFLNIDEALTVSADSNKLRIGLTLQQTSDKKCLIRISDASADFGGFKVTVEDAYDQEVTYLDEIMSYVGEEVLDLFSGKVEEMANPQLKSILDSTITNMDFSKMDICQLL